VGASNPILNRNHLHLLPASVPDIGTQRKVSAILSTYDDLIENNSSRITLLEEMAQRIYREWFVDFRYPGHENIPLIKSELGLIPKGWGVARVGDHADVLRGRSYRSQDLADEGGVPFINLKCIARDGGFRPDWIKRYAGPFKDAHKAQSGDIVMAVTDMTQERRIVARSARVPGMVGTFSIFSMDLVKIVPKDMPFEYVLGLLRYSDFADNVKGYANGANVLHLHPDRIRDYNAVFPSDDVARRYSSVVAPFDRLSDILLAANSRLRATRDLLLSRLISGAINVADLDIALPGAVV
jgi:type I restriction enzyme S subunit